jgi:hypothetical protein
MGDFSIKITVRNAHILNRIMAMSDSVASFCREYGINYQAAVALIGMRALPVNQGGDLTATALNLCSAFGCTPEDLWPKQIEGMKLKRSSGIVELSAAEMQAICGDSEARVIQRELIAKWARVLSPREIEAIGFMQSGMTLDEASKELGGVTRERARQIQIRALRKLRRQAAIGNIKSLSDMEMSE